MIRLVKKIIEEEKILWRTNPREVLFTGVLLFIVIILIWIVL